MKVQKVTKKISTFSKNILPILFLFATLFIYLYKLSALMPFIGDQGWFYLSARDMLLTGKIPLVGITSSHTWLHQGPLWTYLLAGFLKLSNYNPVFPGYMTACVGVITVFILYFVGSKLFSKPAGLLAALLYGTSPLVIIEARMPYHTSFIPIASILYFYCLSQWIKGKHWGFVMCLFLLAVLYNLELATTVLVIPFILVAGYGLYKKTTWFKDILHFKILVAAGILFLLPLMPVIIYDTQHGYPQTIKFILWLFYAAVKPILKHIIFLPSSPTGPDFWTTSLLYLKEIVFIPSVWIAGIILILGVLLFLFAAYKNYREINIFLLFVFFLVTTLSYLAMMIPSEAYLPMMIPFLFLGFAIGFCLVKQKVTRIALYLVLCGVMAGNIFGLIAANYNVGAGAGSTMQMRIHTVERIIREANGRPYTIEGKGPGGGFPSFTMNYRYLAWYMGHPASRHAQKLHFVLEEKGRHIVLTSVLQ